MNTVTFSKLVDQVRHRGVKAEERPASYSAIARRCRITRVFLYVLMNGKCGASEAYRARIARGLKVSESRVKRAIEAQQLVGRRT